MDEDADILDDRSSLRDYLRVLRRRKWIVLITMLVAVGITLAYSLNQPKRYGAKAYVQVPPPGGIDPLAPLAENNLTVDQQRRLMQDETTFARSDAVRKTSRKRLGMRPTYSVEPVVNSSILLITGESEDARQSARIANTVASAYLDESLNQQRDNLRQGLLAGRRAMSSLQAQAKSSPSASSSAAVSLSTINLQRSLASAKVRLDLLTDSGGKMRAVALVPKQPVAPQTSRNVAIAAALGLIFGIAAAFIVDRLDDTIRTKRDMDFATDGLPSLGLIPWSPSWRDAKSSPLISASEPQSPSTEAFRTLRTSVDILGLSGPTRTIAVTSAEPAEGKSATVANLGVVMARAQHRVVAVCCDFRKPRLHQYLGVGNDRGFTSVLVGEATLQQALQPVADVPGLSVLTAGPLPPNPSELLSLPATADILTELATKFDYVLIDCPPVLPVPDALVIAQVVDGMILVAMAKRTTKRRIGRAVELLKQVHAPLLGTVFIGVTRVDGYVYEADAGRARRATLLRRGQKGDVDPSSRSGVPVPAGTPAPDGESRAGNGTGLSLGDWSNPPEN